MPGGPIGVAAALLRPALITTLILHTSFTPSVPHFPYRRRVTSWMRCWRVWLTGTPEPSLGGARLRAGEPSWRKSRRL